MCSPYNFELARACSVVEVLDYSGRSPQNLAAATFKWTGDQLRAVLDYINNAHIVAICIVSVARIRSC